MIFINNLYPGQKDKVSKLYAKGYKLNFLFYVWQI